MRKLVVTLSTRPAFEVPTADNSQHITLNDNYGGAPVATWIIGNGTRAIAAAVIAYAHRNGIDARRVGYAVRPARDCEV